MLGSLPHAPMKADWTFIWGDADSYIENARETRMKNQGFKTEATKKKLGW